MALAVKANLFGPCCWDISAVSFSGLWCYLCLFPCNVARSLFSHISNSRNPRDCKSYFYLLVDIRLEKIEFISCLLVLNFLFCLFPTYVMALHFDLKLFFIYWINIEFYWQIAFT